MDKNETFDSKKPQGESRTQAQNRLVLTRTMVLMLLCGVILFVPLVCLLYTSPSPRD